MIFICLRIVDLPDSPAPEGEMKTSHFPRSRSSEMTYRARGVLRLSPRVRRLLSIVLSKAFAAFHRLAFFRTHPRCTKTHFQGQEFLAELKTLTDDSRRRRSFSALLQFIAQRRGKKSVCLLESRVKSKPRERERRKVDFLPGQSDFNRRVNSNQPQTSADERTNNTPTVAFHYRFLFALNKDCTCFFSPLLSDFLFFVFVVNHEAREEKEEEECLLFLVKTCNGLIWQIASSPVSRDKEAKNLPEESICGWRIWERERVVEQSRG